MAIESGVNYLLIFTSFSFLNNPLIKSMREEFEVEIPFFDIKDLNEELTDNLDSYIYIRENNSEVFDKIRAKYPNINLTCLGTVSGDDILELFKSCHTSLLSSINMGKFYQITENPFKNLIIKAIGLEGKQVVGEYMLLSEPKQIKVPCNNLRAVNRGYSVIRDATFKNYLEGSQKMGIKKAVIVDGHNVLFRNIYGYSNMYTQKDDRFIGGSHGFYFTLLKIKEMFPEYEVHVVFDGYDQEKFENNPEYKAHRQRKSEKFWRAFLENLEWVKMFVEASGFHLYHLSDKEGDDIIGSLAHSLLEEHNYKHLFVYSTDMDFYQLVSDRLSLFVPKLTFRGHSKQIGVKEALDKFKVNQISKINWFRSLRGDISDNIISINSYYNSVGLSISKIRTNEYLKVINRVDTVEDLKAEMLNLHRFKVFFESDQFDTNLDLLNLKLDIFKGIDLQAYQKDVDGERCVQLLEYNSFYKEIEMWPKNFRVLQGLW